MNEPEVFVGQPKSGKENLIKETWAELQKEAESWDLGEKTVGLPGRHGSTPPSVLHGHFLALVREMSGPVFIEDTEFTGANRAARRRNSKVNKASYMRMLPGRF